MVDGGSVGGVVEAKLGGSVGRVDVVAVLARPLAQAASMPTAPAASARAGARHQLPRAGSQLPQRGDALLERRVGVEQAVEA